MGVGSCVVPDVNQSHTTDPICVCASFASSSDFGALFSWLCVTSSTLDELYCAMQCLLFVPRGHLLQNGNALVYVPVPLEIRRVRDGLKRTPGGLSTASPAGMQNGVITETGSRRPPSYHLPPSDDRSPETAWR